MPTGEELIWTTIIVIGRMILDDIYILDLYGGRTIFYIVDIVVCSAARRKP